MFDGSIKKHHHFFQVASVVIGANVTMPDLNDPEIQALVEHIKADPSLLDCSTGGIVFKFPQLDDVYKLNDADELKKFQKFWNKLKIKLRKQMNTQSSAIVRAGPAPPSMYTPFTMMMSPANNMGMHPVYYQPPTPQVVPMVVNHNNFNFHEKVSYTNHGNTNTVNDQTKLKDDIIEGVTAKLEPKLATLHEAVSTARKEPPSSAQRAAARQSPMAFVSSVANTSASPGTTHIRKSLFSCDHDDSMYLYFQNRFNNLNVEGPKFRLDRIEDIKREKDYQFPMAVSGISLDELVEKADLVLVYKKSLGTFDDALVYVGDKSKGSFDESEGTGLMGIWNSAGAPALGFGFVHNVSMEIDQNNELVIVVATRAIMDASKPLSDLLEWVSQKSINNVTIEACVTEHSNSIPLHGASLGLLASSKSVKMLTIQQGSLNADQLGALVKFPTTMMYTFKQCHFNDNAQSLLVHYPADALPQLKLCFDGQCPKIQNLLIAIENSRIQSLHMKNINIRKQNMACFQRMYHAAMKQGWKVGLVDVKCDEGTLGPDMTVAFFEQDEYRSVDSFIRSMYTNNTSGVSAKLIGDSLSAGMEEKMGAVRDNLSAKDHENVLPFKNNDKGITAGLADEKQLVPSNVTTSMGDKKSIGDILNAGTEETMTIASERGRDVLKDHGNLLAVKVNNEGITPGLADENQRVPSKSGTVSKGDKILGSSRTKNTGAPTPLRRSARLRKAPSKNETRKMQH